MLSGGFFVYGGQKEEESMRHRKGHPGSLREALGCAAEHHRDGGGGDGWVGGGKV